MRGVAVILMVLACAAPAAGTTGSGLYGKVMRGPVTPVCVAEKPCARPAAGARLEFLRGSTLIVRVVTARDGTYKLGLKPGSYHVRVALSGRVGSRLEPATVRVVAAHWLRQNFAIDTGIR